MAFPLDELVVLVVAAVVVDDVAVVVVVVVVDDAGDCLLSWCDRGEGLKSFPSAAAPSYKRKSEKRT